MSSVQISLVILRTYALYVGKQSVFSKLAHFAGFFGLYKHNHYEDNLSVVNQSVSLDRMALVMQHSILVCLIGIVAK